MPPEEHEKAAALLACYGEGVDTANREYMKQMSLSVDGEDLTDKIGHFKMKREHDGCGNITDEFEIEIFGHTPNTISSNTGGNYSRAWSIYLPDYQYGETLNLHGFDYEYDPVQGSRIVLRGATSRTGVYL